MFKLTKKQKDILRKEFGMESCDISDIADHCDELVGRIYQIYGNFLENGEFSEENYDLIGTLLRLFNWLWSQEECRYVMLE